MSVRSTVGFSNTETPEIINPYPVNFNSTILLNGEIGPEGQVISSNGDGTMSWVPTGGAGSVPTLAQVLAVGASANNLAITSVKGISNTTLLTIGSDATINLTPATGLAVSGDVGTAGQVLTSNGSAPPSWEDALTSVPTLSAVMTAGAIASTDLDMAQNDILNCAAVSNSTAVLALTSNVGIGMDTTALNLQLSSTLSINGNVGEDGQFLTSQGAGQPPYWTDYVQSVPPLGTVMTAGATASTDLSMGLFDITNCASVSNNGTNGILNLSGTLGVSVAGVCNFSDSAPICSTPALANTDLTNKLYVDTLASTINGVNPSYAPGYTWAGPQIIEGDATLAGIIAPNKNNAIQSALVHLAVSGDANAYYHVVNDTVKTFDPANYVLDATLVYEGSADDAIWYLPPPSAEYVGCSFLFRNMSATDKNLQIQITGELQGLIQSQMWGGNHTRYKKFTMSYAQFEFRFVCMYFPYVDDYVWSLTYTTAAAWYETAYGGTNIYTFDN